MITVSVKILETDESNGNRDLILSNDLLSVNNFIAGGLVRHKVKMDTPKTVLLSSLVDSLDAVTSVTIVSTNDEENVKPLFDVSVMGTSNNILANNRCAMYSVASITGFTNDIQIDNFENVGTNPVLHIIVTTND